ncbi:hypothetical protein ACS0TY_005081 [Phlomoides rotata]
MIGWGDVCKVVVAMVPLYVALGLGYGSVKWWGMFKADECDAINRFTCYFILPFFTFHFTAGVNPYAMNFRFLGGDVVAKAMAGVALAAWAKYGGGDLSWAITTFSLSCFNNTLVVGVPLLRAMYGEVGEDLVVQSSVIQALLWFPILLFLLEFWRATDDDDEIPAAAHVSSASDNSSMPSLTLSSSSNLGATMKKVGAKLGKNPNCYASALGLIWALLANRWNFKMPSILEGSILIMAKAGSGVSMFTIGTFMALQEKLIACGMRLAFYGMVLRFVGGPITTALGSLALGLRSNILSIAILQAALPEAISAFVFAQEYGLHANVLSTAVIFGTIVSLPLLIAYYTVLDLILH